MASLQTSHADGLCYCSPSTELLLALWRAYRRIASLESDKAALQAAVREADRLILISGAGYWRALPVVAEALAKGDDDAPK